jgi:hypothetical protein
MRLGIIIEIVFQGSCALSKVCENPGLSDMPARALIEVDMRIAVLREETSQGKGNARTVAEMEELLKKRQELILKMVEERAEERSQGRAE